MILILHSWKILEGLIWVEDKFLELNYKNFNEFGLLPSNRLCSNSVDKTFGRLCDSNQLNVYITEKHSEVVPDQLMHLRW